jgi:hypothetical protein
MFGGSGIPFVSNTISFGSKSSGFGTNDSVFGSGVTNKNAFGQQSDANQFKKSSITFGSGVSSLFMMQDLPVREAKLSCQQVSIK